MLPGQLVPAYTYIHTHVYRATPQNPTKDKVAAIRVSANAKSAL